MKRKDAAHAAQRAHRAHVALKGCVGAVEVNPINPAAALLRGQRALVHVAFLIVVEQCFAGFMLLKLDLTAF
jgi:hypothetical protein